MNIRKFLVRRLAGISIAALGGVVICEAVRLLKFRKIGIVGDETFPFLLGATFIILGVLHAAFAGQKETRISFPKGPIRRKMILAAMVVSLYALMIPFLGYTMSTLAALIALFRILGAYHWLKCVAFGFLFTVALHLLFITWLTMPFPAGLLELR